MIKIKNYITLAISVLCSSVLFAGPGTYYNSIDTNKACSLLKTQLYHLISSNITTIPYTQVDNFYNYTDLKPAEAGGGDVIVDRYCSENPSGLDYCTFRYSVDFCGTRSSSNQCYCYNKEHTFPDSWFGGSNDAALKDAYSDMHFIWPADTKTNIEKSNYPYGYVQAPSFTSNNGTKIGTSNSSLNYGYTSSKVFEPIDSFKGDFARAYLYFVTRYEDSLSSMIGRSISANVLAGNKYPALKPWILQLCVKWSKIDPPSAFEIKRNDFVFSLQGNRNPYIDYPNWVEKVFGPNGNYTSCVSTGIRESRTAEFYIYPNPVKDALLNIQSTSAFAEDVTIEIADMLGRIIKTQKINAGTLPSVNVSSLGKGMYFLNIIYKGTNYANTFIKE